MQAGILKTLHISSTNQLAGVFTKALHPSLFRDLISKMRLINIYSPSWGGVLSSELLWKFVRVEFVSNELDYITAVCYNCK